MNQAISAEEVDAVTGKTGYKYFPEAASDAPKGNPACSFTHSDGIQYKIGFFAFTQGKQAKYDYFKDFGVEVKEVDSPLWDSGCIADFKDGSFAIIVLRGDNCMRISWVPDAHAGHEKAELASLLAGMLIQNLYGGANAGQQNTPPPSATPAATPASPSQTGTSIPDAVPDDLTDVAFLNKFAVDLYLEHIKPNIFSAPIHSEEGLDNARKALSLIIEATTRAIDMYDKGSDIFHLRGMAHAHCYYDAKIRP